MAVELARRAASRANGRGGRQPEARFQLRDRGPRRRNLGLRDRAEGEGLQRSQAHGEEVGPSSHSKPSVQPPFRGELPKQRTSG